MIAACCLSWFTFILSGACLVLPYWVYEKGTIFNNKFEFGFGLWAICLDPYGRQDDFECSIAIPDPGNTSYFVSWLLWNTGVLLVMICAFISPCCCLCNSNRCCMVSLGVLNYIAGILFLITMFIVTIDSGLVGERYDNGTEALYLSWLYYVAWLTTVMTIVTGVAFSITKHQKRTRIAPSTDTDGHPHLVVRY